ncbi:hypothetical protein EVAR_62433_1 [Eumeta japonica]|uniref:Uncharacterized protein n=1 Tax=Eumeta variegata TaxID=151549 RepID=A0A4C1Z925_EUMVA|nr:hypothetical protein EVAR_62433_1 [Eumeta japonica]
MEEYEAMLATLDDSKPEHEAVLDKVDADFLRIFELADSIQLAFKDIGCGIRLKKKSQKENDVRDTGIGKSREANEN